MDELDTLMADAAAANKKVSAWLATHSAQYAANAEAIEVPAPPLPALVLSIVGIRPRASIRWQPRGASRCPLELPRTRLGEVTLSYSR